MSLGAIDFGFLVDGPIVMLEAVIAATAGKKLVGEAKARAFSSIAKTVARPVAFAVAIIMLVYVPLLVARGHRGQDVPPHGHHHGVRAVRRAWSTRWCSSLRCWSRWFAPPSGHGPRWLELVSHAYARVAPTLVRWRWLSILASVVALVGAGAVFAAKGAEFVPRIFEGDAVITIRRAPSVSLAEAKRLDLATERCCTSCPRWSRRSA
jgi:cobalt-zinc-cadmium resistance protein CzcA